MPVDVIRTIASVGASMVGSGTVSTRTSRLPCQVTAFIGSSSKSGCARVTRLVAAGTPPWSVLRRGPALRAQEDLRHHVALGVGVVVRRLPLLARQRPLGVLVEPAIGGVVA